MNKKGQRHALWEFDLGFFSVCALTSNSYHFLLIIDVGAYPPNLCYNNSFHTERMIVPLRSTSCHFPAPSVSCTPGTMIMAAGVVGGCFFGVHEDSQGDPLLLLPGPQQESPGIAAGVARSSSPPQRDI